MAKPLLGSTHNHYTLDIDELDAVELDVLSFKGEEWLSQPFKYTVAFTSPTQDIDVAKVLGKDASFQMGSSEQTPANPISGAASRTLHGVITGFKRLSSSKDEARYEVTLQARLALLSRGQQYRIYQHKSVPEIVESILRSRHQFEGQHFLFDLAREYPKRQQVMQYGESDLAFISRLLAEVGIWYCFTHNDKLSIDVVEFHDHQRHYQFDVSLPYRPLSGLTSNGQDGVWALQVSHEVVEQHINVRAYHHRDAAAFLEGDVDHSQGATTTYGEGYHYGEPYTALGDAIAQDEELESESGYFYARLNHERYLNGQTRCSGISSSVTLAPGQVVTVTEGAPQVFEPGVVMTHLTVEAARDRSLEVNFEAIPYSESICFRPALPNKPQIAGTVPARVKPAIEVQQVEVVQPGVGYLARHVQRSQVVASQAMNAQHRVDVGVIQLAELSAKAAEQCMGIGPPRRRVACQPPGPTTIAKQPWAETVARHYLPTTLGQPLTHRVLHIRRHLRCSASKRCQVLIPQFRVALLHWRRYQAVHHCRARPGATRQRYSRSRRPSQRKVHGDITQVIQRSGGITVMPLLDAMEHFAQQFPRHCREQDGADFGNEQACHTYQGPTLRNQLALVLALDGTVDLRNRRQNHRCIVLDLADTHRRQLVKQGLWVRAHVLIKVAGSPDRHTAVQLRHCGEKKLSVAAAHEAAEECQIAGTAQAHTEQLSAELLKVGKGTPRPMGVAGYVDQHPLAGSAHPAFVEHIEDDDLLQVARQPVCRHAAAGGGHRHWRCVWPLRGHERAAHALPGRLHHRLAHAAG